VVLRTVGICLVSLMLATSANAAARCQNTGNFNTWLADFKKEALASGISKHTMSEAEPLLSFDQKTIDRDSQQSVFNQTFMQFAERMVNNFRLKKGQSLIKQNKVMFDKIEAQYGIPAPVIVAFWALESDFGATTGKMPILRSLTTLAYDCRRPDLFRTQLLAALKIVERGDLQVPELIGSWAGELGGTQFVPEHYVNFGVDFDGDGRVDLVHSTPDTLATAANYLKSLNWKAGAPWLETVKVPADMPWEQSDLKIQLPRSQWAKWGVTGADGSLPADDMKATLLLPMGRKGPAFLAYDNFKAYLEWNQSFVYSTSAAYLATRIAGAPPMLKGNGEVTPLELGEVKELQTLLTKRGFDVGEIDGKVGSGTRAAVKETQLKLGLPADGYPDAALLSKMRGAGG
jgi:lytic murein transglycosylase